MGKGQAHQNTKTERCQALDKHPPLCLSEANIYVARPHGPINQIKYLNVSHYLYTSHLQKQIK